MFYVFNTLTPHPLQLPDLGSLGWVSAVGAAMSVVYSVGGSALALKSIEPEVGPVSICLAYDVKCSAAVTLPCVFTSPWILDFRRTTTREWERKASPKSSKSLTSSLQSQPSCLLLGEYLLHLFWHSLVIKSLAVQRPQYRPRDPSYPPKPSLLSKAHDEGWAFLCLSSHKIYE